jgi:hypothetical protein
MQERPLLHSPNHHNALSFYFGSCKQNLTFLLYLEGTTKLFSHEIELHCIRNDHNF